MYSDMINRNDPTYKDHLVLATWHRRYSSNTTHPLPLNRQSIFTYRTNEGRRWIFAGAWRGIGGSTCRLTRNKKEKDIATVGDTPFTTENLSIPSWLEQHGAITARKRILRTNRHQQWRKAACRIVSSWRCSTWKADQDQWRRTTTTASAWTT